MGSSVFCKPAEGECFRAALVEFQGKIPTEVEEKEKGEDKENDDPEDAVGGSSEDSSKTTADDVGLRRQRIMKMIGAMLKVLMS
uniref:Uncharacterized protein n=1 Tax=Steinernema glaseri TaxID=37863 RepID=A0A1I7ZTY2_9BILA